MSSFFEIGASERLKNNQLVSLNSMIDWSAIRKLLKGVHSRSVPNENGGFAYDVLSMFKAILLGQWHSLSDPKLEEALRVRLDFMVFTGFGMDGNVPDETTLCRFRNKLIESGLLDKLFEEINVELMQQGLMLRRAECAVVDATIIESAARPNRVVEMYIDRDESVVITDEEAVSESADPYAKWLKKGNRSYFGYKGYVATDSEEGHIIKLEVTPANSSEVRYFKEFTEGLDADRILGDKGYASADNRESLKNRGIKDGIMHKASRGKALRASQKLFNKLVSKKRYIVEQAFGTLKRIFQMSRSNYIGLRKVSGQLKMKAICFNLLKSLNILKTRVVNI
jgi:IS5 family transposase